MIKSQRFRCSKCGKEFNTKGNIFNQIIIRHYSLYKFYMHCMLKHRDTIKPKGWLMIVRETLKWIPLLILQIIEILCIPMIIAFAIYLFLFWIIHI